ncbi:VanZ family protein [Clostridium tyrobutyricum]|jgi:VanZ family protein|uniref:Acetobutylicum phosphotransbutyrylase n=1 Tax=Clostridium tyrobutyricum DIVETGP TaxID=1408889 RepID=W6N840_CLOTY|nr:VanZ family protein [Clostridium tyrobutyricum]AND83314.1 hypothetical protein CTK_C00440 [Clostridium tyrobutyricum]ANP68120.1 hypothetical protein BA182_00025 [Clostridium tyrobutyricum]MBR9649435.1 VanZ family protein [Clostridium tyrobutyricum]MBV4426567.1 VanZ family protein [Clostridium tyrobutyricum]MBV4429649.1 VanZ family protein [Clostridium tyrobutyricum]
MNKKIKWLLVFLWMILIFSFSSQSGVASDEKSRFIVYLFNESGINLNSVFGNLANFAVRKFSHFTEYFILYILLFNALYEKSKMKKTFLLSIVIVFLYACSDEIHQFFVPGRSSRIRDVIIDTSGGFASLLCCLFHSRRKNKYRRDL